MLASQTGLTKNQVLSLILISLSTTCFHSPPSASIWHCLRAGFSFPSLQVSNWFINARVRLWKPMIEEMYKEEFADSSEDSNPLIRGSMTDEDSTNLEDEWIGNTNRNLKFREKRNESTKSANLSAKNGRGMPSGYNHVRILSGKYEPLYRQSGLKVGTMPT